MYGDPAIRGSNPMLPILPGIGLTQYTARRLRLETVMDFNSFLGLKTAWDSLVSSAALDYPFVTHEWIRAWWQSFGGDRTMHIVVVREGNTVVGIAPLLEETERFYGFKLRKLSFIRTTEVAGCDFIVAGRRMEIYRMLWEHIAAQGHRWDLLLLPQLPEGSPTLTYFKELATGSGFLVHTWPSDASHNSMFIYPNNPRTALFNAMKFRLAPLIQELGQAEGHLSEGDLRKCA
jgi:hypothetical protein